MKAAQFLRARYLVMGMAGVSLLLAACSTGGGAEMPQVNTPMPERVTVANTPTPERGTVVSTPTSTPAAQQTTPTATPTAPPVARPTSPPALAPREIKVTLKNNTFPKEIRVKAGEKVVFVVTNNGTVKHTFEFPDFDEMRYNEIQKGETVRIEWLVPNRKGEWDMGCFLTEEGFHEGMEGTLIIE